MEFSVKHTNIAKGVALLMLLWHHLFFNNPQYFDRYVSMFWIKGVPIEAFLASFCKVCVAIFLFLSGYGLYKSYFTYQRHMSEKKGEYKSFYDLVFIKNRYVKLMSSYWVIYLLFVPIGLLLGRSFIEIYSGNPVCYFSDIFGVSYLFFGLNHSMNVTWWYMSVIIVYYVLYPIIHRLLEKYAEIILIFSIASALLLPNIRELQLWIAPFVFGSYISKYNGFEKISRLLNTRLKQIVFCSVLIVLAAYIRYFRFGNTPKCDFLFAFSIILFCYFIIGRIPIVNRVLEELGKKSGLIFMFHTFIYSYYFKEFIYSFKYSVIIFIIMLVICYAIAWFIHWLMNITGYTKMIKKVTS